MIKHCLVFCLIFALVVTINPVGSKAQQPDPYLDFARNLFQGQDFYRAVTEARRFLFLNPDHPRRFEAYLILGRSYFELKQFSQAKKAYNEVINQKDRPDLALEAVWELGRCIELLGSRSEAISYYRRLIRNPPATAEKAAVTADRARFRLGWLLLEQGQWLESGEVFSTVTPGHPLGDSAAKLSEQVLEGQELPYVSTTAAGMLSAVLPGAGQIYARRPVDAALAFGLNTAFLWGTIEAYQEESWAVFTLLGLIEVALYGGNIYNAVNGAHIHNREIKRSFIEKLRREHALSFGYSSAHKGAYFSWLIKY